MTDPPAQAALAAEDAQQGTAPAPAVGAGLSISVEAMAWAAVLAAAAALRTASLERPPFAVAEAARTLDAARVAGGTVPDTWSGDMVAALASYLFRLFDEGELLARALPAAAGTALVAVLWFARPCLGRGGALVAGALVAFSPLFIILARSALPFSAGALLAAVMVFSLFAYLRDQRPWLVFLFAVSLALAPLTDAVAVSAALAVLAFLALEGGLFGNEEIARAWGAFRRSPTQWLSVLLVLAAALELGFTHFGTSLERGGLSGLEQWTGMFDLPRDSRPPEYSLALLLAYDWPLLLAGALGFILLAHRLLRAPSSLPPFQRFLLLWTALAALTAALTTQRQAGQALILLLPLALLAGARAEEAASAFDWSVLRRWWPLLLACLALIAYGALLLTEGSTDSGMSVGQQFLAVVALGGAVALLAGAYSFLLRDATVLAAAVVLVLAVAFLAHSSLAVAFGDGAEFALDLRIQGRADQFRDTVDLLAAERSGPIVVDDRLGPTLTWPLRDSPVVLGGDLQDASAIIAPEGEAPPGFVPLGEAWRLAQGWYPQDLDFLPLWRWLVFREPYGKLDTVDVRIYVPTP